MNSWGESSNLHGSNVFKTLEVSICLMASIPMVVVVEESWQNRTIVSSTHFVLLASAAVGIHRFPDATFGFDVAYKILGGLGRG